MKIYDEVLKKLSIDHVGYLVNKIDRARNELEHLGYKTKSEIIRDEYRKIDILFMGKNGYVIELVCPFSKESKVSELLRRKGNGPYHICYRCTCIEETKQAIERCGYIICDEIHEAIAFDNKKVCFFIHPYIGIIELLEES